MSARTARSLQLLRELFAAERAASRAPRREAARLEDTPPASALRAVAAHADETLDSLTRLAGARDVRERPLLWDAIGLVAGALRDVVRGRLEDAPHAYRRALLELRRGLDLVRLLRASAREEGDEELVAFADAWLGVRLRLVAGAEAELEWLGRHDAVLSHASRRRTARVLLFGTAVLGAGAACEDAPTPPTVAAVDVPTPPPAPLAPVAPLPEAPGPAEASAPAPVLGGGDAGAPAERPPFVHVDVNHVLSTGQSNSVANDGKPVLSTTQPFANLMFDVGVMTGAQCDGDGCRAYDTPRAFVPLVEGDQFFSGSSVETMSSSLANTASRLAREGGALDGTGETSHDVLVSLHGRSGNSYWCLRRGGCPWWSERGYVKPWDDGMRQVADAARLAAAAGKSYAVRAITAIHGEHDHYAWSSGASHFPLPRTDGRGMLADYGEGLLEWQRDYDAEIRAITGQTISPPLLVSQYSHWNDVPTTVIAYQQLRAHVVSDGKVIVVGPTYALPYTSTCLHFTGAGERWLGEYFGKVYARVVLERRRWDPLRPIAVARSGATLTVRYVVPSPPIVLDTEHVRDPGDRGFEVVDAQGARLAIADVAVTGPDTVAVRLADAAAVPARIRYAYTFTGCGGSGTIARGNVRDSDPTPSAYGNPLWNWSVHFDEPVP